MIKQLFLLSSSLMLAALTSHAQQTNRLHFPSTGFSIAPLQAPASRSTQQAIMMFLPAVDGFAANVNVQIQPYTSSIEDYLALSVRQFETAGFTLLHQKIVDKSVAVLEYTGEMQGRLLHWYARVEKSADKVYLATATATDEQWSQVASPLKACVDSFRCDTGEHGAAPNAAPPRR